MLSTPRIAFAALILATPFGVASAATQGTAASHQGAETAQPGFGMAQSDATERPGMGGPMQQPADDGEDDDDSFATPGMTGGMMGGGMMGQGMMGSHGAMGRGMCGAERPMMQMMQGMMQMMQGMTRMQMMAHRHFGPASRGMMMPGHFVGEHLDRLKDELGITASQEPQWNGFAAAVRARVKAMQDLRGDMMREGRAAAWPDRMARHEHFLSARLDALKAMEGPTKALWDALSDAQRHRAEEIMPGMMGAR